MRLYAAIAVVVACLHGCLSAQPASKIPGADSLGYRTVFSQLIAPAADGSKIAAVSGVRLTRDVGTIDLTSGRIYMAKPIAGRGCMAMFVGAGTFSFTPPTALERDQLRRYYKSDTMRVAFTRMFLLFADSTAEELAARAKFAPGTPEAEWDHHCERSLHFISKRDAGYVMPAFATALLNGDRSDLFYAEFTGESGTFFFQIDPYFDRYDDEEVRFMRMGEQRGEKFHEVISQFRRQGRNDERTAAENPLVRIKDYRIDLRIAESMDVAGVAEMTFSLARPARWFHLSLYHELRVDSIVWGNGRRAEFAQTGLDVLWVRNDPGAAVGGSAVARVYYHGVMFSRIADWVMMREADRWYPKHDNMNRATYDITYHYPDNFRLASSGKMLSTEERDGVVTSRWAVTRPSRFASFGIGIYNVQRLTPDSVAPITVYRGPNSSGGLSEQIAWDLENSLKFFEFLYGKVPMEEFHATEIPAGHGQAFPGLIHLSVSTFDRNDGSGSHEVFRSHEVAHQWWGITLDYRNYHDQWLSEGFAEYSGLMFMQAVLKDNDKFFGKLRDYRRALINVRKSVFGSGVASGPIALGSRNNTTSAEGDYFLVIYQKGAWVLHMLRNMLLDLPTMKEDRYRALMREFFTTYSDKPATTEDFRRIAERHAGGSLEWFFRQWVEGTDIPSYKWAYKVEEAGGGKYRIVLRVETANVAPDFQMYVPIKVDFGDGKIARVRALIKGPHSEQQLPLMPLKPRSLGFNEFESVLCEAEEVSWD